MCRKIAIAKLTGRTEIEIWGDGEQTRSFCYIDDCVEGLYAPHATRTIASRSTSARTAWSASTSSPTWSRRRRASTIAKRHIAGPQGVRGRNSDNTRLRQVLGWEPQISLEEGLARTYRWIEEQVAESLRADEVTDAVA